MSRKTTYPRIGTSSGSIGTAPHVPPWRCRDRVSDSICRLTADGVGNVAGVRPFLRTPFNETMAVIAPDGRWLAYQSNESGRYEVYVQPFPGGGRPIPISTGGGVFPRWSSDGRELYFRSGE